MLSVRVAFFVLLFANLVFMAWAGWVDTPPRAKTSDANARLPKLKLVSEVSTPQQTGRGGGTLQKMAMTPSAAASGAVPVASTRCVSVGPFNDIAAAAKAAAFLRTRGFVPAQRAAPGETRDGYWVYIGGVADAATADKIFKTLDSSGIKDAHLMPESGDARRISVGLFSERDRAERRTKAIQRLGLKAEVEEHTQPGTVYWVDLALKPSDPAVPVEDLRSADSGNNHWSVEGCPDRASARPSPRPAATPVVPAPGPLPAAAVAGTPNLR
jgi:cell division septation protein DedD